MSLFLAGISCVSYLLPLPFLQRAAAPRARGEVALQIRSWSHFGSSWSDFSGQEQLESNIRGNWEHIDSIVAASNAREDIGGVVGGSYLIICSLLLLVSVMVAFFFFFSELFFTEVTSEFFEEPLVVKGRPRPGAAAKWKAGMPLPSLAELTNRCAIIGDKELGCQP